MEDRGRRWSPGPHRRAPPVECVCGWSPSEAWLELGHARLAGLQWLPMTSSLGCSQRRQGPGCGGPAHCLRVTEVPSRRPPAAWPIYCEPGMWQCSRHINPVSPVTYDLICVCLCFLSDYLCRFGTRPPDKELGFPTNRTIYWHERKGVCRQNSAPTKFQGKWDLCGMEGHIAGPCGSFPQSRKWKGAV